MGKSTLSCSEWVAAVKLNTNYANLAGVPGTNSFASNRCRRCHSEIETPSHVLGACDFGGNQRNERHHAVKYKLNALLKAKGLECFDEASCVDNSGSKRRIDILAFDPKSNKAFLIDPTVRFETNRDMDSIVQKDKADIYEHCYKDLAERYKQYGIREYEVIGLWIGARGTISSSMVDFFDRFQLDKSKLPAIAEMVLSVSIRIIHHHIYASS